MISQYLKLKEQAGRALLFYRMGDFYELFFEDAEVAAGTLQIALTRRGRYNDQDVPMCGVPVQAAEGYIARLVRAGLSIAIAEQAEDPAAARRESRPVKREIVRVVTPATLTEESLLDPRTSNWLVAIAPSSKKRTGVAWADISTGHLLVTDLPAEQVDNELARLGPSEIIGPDDRELPRGAVQVSALWFSEREALKRLHIRYNVQTLDSFGSFTSAEIAAMGGLSAYVDAVCGAITPPLSPPVRVVPTASMMIDASSRMSLMLGREGLVDVIDRSVTAAGARLLAEDISAPLTCRAAIEDRLDAITALIADKLLRQALRQALRAAPDLERPLTRLAIGRGSPRDLAGIGRGLAAAATVRMRLATTNESRLLNLEAAAIADHAHLQSALADALVAEPGLSVTEGGFIADGFDPELDSLRAVARDGRKLILDLEARYRSETGISALKVRHNGILGYHIDVPARAEAAMRSAGFAHRQTLAGSVRFGSQELADLAARIAGAAEAAIALETAHFERLTQMVLSESTAIGRTAAALARIDVVASHAELADNKRWVRPELTDSADFFVEGGRHPIVEAAIASEGHVFVGNHCDLGQQQLWLVTGPNMGGKSTYLRQNAIIAILAQAGCFVPAENARIGIVDKLFSRVGASDDLAAGRSTFMVEMVETASILRQATGRSLVILDEIGRGTSTFDGLAIAWSVVEWLHDHIGCRTLFATHYHELTRLADRLSGIRNVSLRAREWRGDLIFLHEVADGAADRSYGIAVARLAGVPEPVLVNAREILARLEAARPNLDLGSELPLFATTTPTAARAGPPDPLRATLREIDIDEISPREAHRLLAELQTLA